MRLRLPRRSRGEPDPENAAPPTRQNGQSDDGPPEPEASEFAVGADPRDYEVVGEGERPGGDDSDEIAEEPTASTVPPVVVPRWVQLVLLPLALLGLWALARAAGTVLLILVVASVVALILNPLVRMLERIKVPRGLAIAAVYLSWVAVIVGIGVAAVRAGQRTRSAISRTTCRTSSARPTATSTNLQNFLNNHGIKVHIQQQGQTALQTLQKDVAQALGRHRLVLARPAAADRHDRLRPGPDPRALDLPAGLRQADRRAGAADHARMATARPRTTSRC